LRRAFADELPRALAAAGVELLPPNQIDMKIAERPEFLQCRAGACLAEEAAFLQVKRLFVPRFDKASDGGFTIGVSVYDAGQKRTIGDVVDRVATVADVRAKLGAMGQKLGSDLSRPGRVEVSCTPPATVLVDGSHRGTTPWAGAITPGDHVVSLEGGGTRVERDVNVAPGQVTRVDVQLDLPPAAPKPRGGGRSVLFPVKIAMLAGGVVALATGGALVAIDGEGTCDLKNGAKECRMVYDTKLPGYITLAGGGALVVGSVIMFVLDRPRK
jgi:hypothetical protein